MQFNAGIVTHRFAETREFYTRILGWRVDFENEFYLLLGAESGSQISFLLPEHPTQNALFQPEFNGKGVYITVNVADVDREYERIKALDVPVVIEPRDEPWGERHFAIVDPNGIGVDIVTFIEPTSQ
jgi:catechol 2,3-dioxygenase-like lactoylglutathione lyase family enzyme